MSFKQAIAEDYRLCVLRVLNEDAGYSHNHFVIKQALAYLGHAKGVDYVLTQLNWLAEQELITTTESSGITIATLTQRGKDVATGATTVPGVKRPEPEA